ncbi:MAG: tRNA glutamyl-Q(34) synthetase GluQRS [Woeseiaceae bacterium]
MGRFAPSPTGPLHFGSLVAAVASYLQARTHEGRWLVRVEDIDPPREQPGASARIIGALERYGFEWDGDVSFQSRSRPAHDEAVERLLDQGMAYPCGCSRKDLADASRGPLGTIYPGNCRAGCEATETAIRIRTTDEPIAFDDALQGTLRQRLESESGDFVIRRRDGLIAYQLAVVIDDALQGVTEIVRGIDLIDSTVRQIWLQRLLACPTPAYVHIPVVIHPDGDKLSKLTGAPAIPVDEPRPTLVAALAALQQGPPSDLAAASLPDIWRWAADHWKLDTLRGLKGVRTDRIAGSSLTVTPYLK